MRLIHKTRLSALLAVCAITLTGQAASAAIVTISVDGTESWGFLGDSDNTVLIVDLGAALGFGGAVVVDGIGWLVDIDTVGDSWLSEASISFQDSSAAAFVNLSPGIDDTFAGAGSYDSGGVIDLVSLGLTFTVADGLLRLEFYESFDDVGGAVDALWNGELLIRASAVPVPPAVALLISGLGALGLGAGRRRRFC